MRDIRLGVFGARADRRGLAVQLAEFCRHLQPDKVWGIDMKELSPYYNLWTDYDPRRLTVTPHDQIRAAEVRAWLADLDVVWGAETFYQPWFTALCAEEGVRTVLAVNPEFAGHVLAPDWAPRPDRLAPPTPWRLDLLPGAEPMPHGLCRHRLPFRLRTECRTFLHVVGHPAFMDRPGTGILLDALRFLRQPCSVILRSQDAFRPDRTWRGPMPSYVEVRYVSENAEDYWDVYAEGDVLVSPRRYGGQHLPMMEALSCGMPVLVTDCAPQDSLLPGEMLVPAASGQSFASKAGPNVRIDLVDCLPQALAARMDQLASEPAVVERLSKAADQIAAEHSWAALLPRYRAMFEDLCRSTSTPPSPTIS